MYFENGRIDIVEVVFYLISKKDVVLWIEMIIGYFKMVDGENVVKFFYNMWKEGYKIDGFVLSCVLSVCVDFVILK